MLQHLAARGGQEGGDVDTLLAQEATLRAKQGAFEAVSLKRIQCRRHRLARIDRLFVVIVRPQVIRAHPEFAARKNRLLGQSQSKR